ncbi:MAG TPA: phosphatase PAP2 family protein [Casimicrobiaceae bacterium]|nr:phosphatase PAP2 family protein [Casimicrobiaceae bacterium]
MPSSNLRLAAFSLAALAAILLWDVSGLDLPLARAMGGAEGFPLRDTWILATLLHAGARDIAWLVFVALCLQVAWPVGVLRQVPSARRVQIVVSAMIAWALVGLMKYRSHTSCPWDLEAFGGVARHLSHWASWSAADGGPGRCFPAGHATAGFAFVGGYFALRRDLPELAARWLACALAAGALLGVVQQLRGAHFLSHTLWTAWLCWVASWACDPWFAPRERPAPTVAIRR